jgi:hypothetical protein
VANDAPEMIPLTDAAEIVLLYTAEAEGQ